MSSISRGMLKISELAEECGLPVSTIRHYVNEGLLGEPRKSSKNMAYYDPETIPRVSLIKRLQDEFFLPLSIIKKLFLSDEELSFDDYDLIVEVKRKLSEHTHLLPEVADISYSTIIENLHLTDEELMELERLGVVSPQMKKGERHYNEMDYRVVKALSDFRESGFSAELGFSTEDINIYLPVIKELVRTEARLFVERITRDKSVEEIAELIRNGLPVLNEIIGALHDKVAMEMFRQLEDSARPRRK